MIVTIKGSSFSSTWVMRIDLKDLLYPDPWVDEIASVAPERKGTANIYRKDHTITKVKKVFRLIHTHCDPETWERVRDYILENPIRRYKQYLEIWRTENERIQS